MAQLNETTAENLRPEQAVELSRVIELQARWENHRDETGLVGCSANELLERQRRYSAFRTHSAEFATRHRAIEIPELTLNTPVRLALWCRVIVTVFRRAESRAAGPVEVVSKAYRLADRVADRLKTDHVARGAAPSSMEEAIRDLENVILWCNHTAGHPTTLSRVWHPVAGESEMKVA